MDIVRVDFLSAAFAPASTCRTATSRIWVVLSFAAERAVRFTVKAEMILAHQIKVGVTTVVVGVPGDFCKI